MRQSEEASLGSPRSDASMLGLFFSLPSAPPPWGPLSKAPAASFADTQAGAAG